MGRKKGRQTEEGQLKPTVSRLLKVKVRRERERRRESKRGEEKHNTIKYHHSTPEM